MIEYRKEFHEIGHMSFFIKDNKLLEKYNEIQGKVKNIIIKQLDSEPVYNEKNLKAKIKSCSGKINTNFHNNKIPKEGPQFVCSPVILIDSILSLETGKDYYPQVFLEECKYVIKKKIPKYIIDDIEIFSGSDGENCDEEILMQKIQTMKSSDNEKKIVEEILMKKIQMKKTSDDGNSSKEYTSEEK